MNSSISTLLFVPHKYKYIYIYISIYHMYQPVIVTDSALQLDAGCIRSMLREVANLAHEELSTRGARPVP